MKTIIKRLDVRNARLYSISSGKRLHVADFQGMVDLNDPQKWCIVQLNNKTRFTSDDIMLICDKLGILTEEIGTYLLP